MVKKKKKRSSTPKKKKKKKKERKKILKLNRKKDLNGGKNVSRQKGQIWSDKVLGALEKKRGCRRSSTTNN